MKMIDIPRHLVGATVLALAVGIVIGLFAAELPPGNREIALVILGVAIKWASDVVHFHFGTSESSTRKQDYLEQRGIDDRGTGN